MSDPMLLAYLAGIFDGEGSMGNYRSGKYTYFSMEVKMTHQQTIDLLHDTFGGSKVYRAPQKEGWQEQWRWRVRGKQAEVVYASLKPYLRIKLR